MKGKQIRFIGFSLAIGLMSALTMVMVSCSAVSISPISSLKLSSIALAPASPAKLTVGYTMQFFATGTYSDGSTVDITSKVTWTSSNTTIANIDSTGLVTGVAAGNTNITAVLSGITSPAVNLPVISLAATPSTTTPAPTLSSIAVTPGLSLNILVGSTQQFVAIGTYSDGTTSVITTLVTWASSNTTIVTISSAGLATGIATGTVNITANMPGVTSQPITLTVTSS